MAYLSILITCLLPIVLSPYILLAIHLWRPHPLSYRGYLPESPWEVSVQVWGFVLGIVYILARLALLVETFRALAFLPPDAYVSTWVSNVPNVS